MNKTFHVHQVSDATGETLSAIAKAALAQFEGVTVQEHAYTLVRSRRQLERAVEHIRENPGLVFFTLASLELRDELIAQCARLAVPCLDVLETPMAMMRQFLGTAETHRPGGQHEVDQRYLLRISRR
ncbi:MAG: kinase/pyrophosphorylase [Rhizomicrobium sp.]